MIDVSGLKSKASNRYRDVLRALILGENPFPLAIRIKLPSNTAPISELRDCYAIIRSQSRECLGYGYSVEWTNVVTRRYGDNEVPQRLFFADREDFFRYIGKDDEARRILNNAGRIQHHFPQGGPWCASNIALLGKSPETIQSAILVVEYLQAHPFPVLFARQLPVAVSTKFIEQERGLLESLANAVAPEVIREKGESFEEKAGLLTKASLIEFLSLDESVKSLPFRRGMATARELTERMLLFESFETVIVIENHITFLTLPKLPETVAIMGQGNAVHRLEDIKWLQMKSRIFYWGDIDVPGFQILSRLRRRFPSLRSVMMERMTFDRSATFHQKRRENTEISERDREYLTESESRMLQHLVDHSLMLEQEHIEYQYAADKLADLFLER